MTNLWSVRCNYYLLHGVSMILTGHKTGAVCDRYNIVNERELLAAGEQLAAYLGSSSSSGTHASVEAS